MKDGWYLITRSDGKRFVEYVFRNNTDRRGTVRELSEQGCLIEEVVISTTDGQILISDVHEGMRL